MVTLCPCPCVQPLTNNVYRHLYVRVSEQHSNQLYARPIIYDKCTYLKEETQLTKRRNWELKAQLTCSQGCTGINDYVQHYASSFSKVASVGLLKRVKCKRVYHNREGVAPSSNTYILIHKGYQTIQCHFYFSLVKLLFWIPLGL